MFGLKLVRESELQDLREKVINQENQVKDLKARILRQIQMIEREQQKSWIYDLTEEQLKKVIVSAYSRIFAHKQNVFEALKIAKQNVLKD